MIRRSITGIALVKYKKRSSFTGLNTNEVFSLDVVDPVHVRL